MDLKDLYNNLDKYLNKEISLEGWIKNHRKQKEFGFIDFYDGTIFENIQIFYDNKLNNFDEINHFGVGSSIKVIGILKESNKNQKYEIVASNIILIADAVDFPIQPKKHTREFLRSVAHLRGKTNLFQAVFRIRSVASFAIHSYFQNNGYLYVNTPLITTADCEGENQMFKITTLDFNNIPNINNKVDTSKDLFSKTTYITGTGQLHGEAFAMAFKKIYTFGPTFRTENSNTKTHANEFWMIEPEIAFCDINNLMDIEEDMLKYVVNYVLKNCSSELKFLDEFVENGLIDKLTKLVSSKFVRITHHDVVDILLNSKENFTIKPSYDSDISKECEKYITEYFNGPVFITNWPKDIKAWYMKVNPDNKTVAAVDLEVPGAGELMGGSQREEDYELLIKRMREMNVDISNVNWFCDLRKYGTCIHSGFGMGFERLLIYLTGVENIRDVIPFPRTPGSCEF